MKLAAMFLALSTLLVGCNTVNAQINPEAEQIKSIVQNSSIKLKAEDSYTDWRTGTYEEIKLGTESVTITKAGTYVLSGELSDGQIFVNASSQDDVRLVLNGVKIVCKDNAPIYVENADKVILSLVEGTENILIDGTNENAKAVIHAKDDLTINGKGTLLIEANNKHGIACNNELVIMDGNINILSVADGINVKQDIFIQSGSITIDAGQDAIQSDLTMEVVDGTFNLISGGGSANGTTHIGGFGGPAIPIGGPAIPKGEENFVPTDRPELPPEAMNGGKRPELPPEAMNGGERPELPPEAMTGGERPELPPEAMTGGERPELPSEAMNGGERPELPPEAQTTTETNTEATSTSKKGIKAGENLWLQGGTYTINAADDAIHSNGNLTIYDGKFTIETGDDGIHSTETLIINGGTIDITKSYEGLEAKKITINDGDIKVKASDDGINVTEGSSEAEQENMHFNMKAGNAELIINGGTIFIDADGDGLDANGSITINGGKTIVVGPTSGGDGALDYDKTCVVNAGMLIATGSSRMAQTISDTSSVNAFDMSFNQMQTVGNTLKVVDEKGNVVIEHTPTKSFQSVVIASPLLEKGKAYTYLYNDKTIAEVKLEQTVTYLNESGVTTSRAGGNMRPGGPGKKGQTIDTDKN